MGVADVGRDKLTSWRTTYVPGLMSAGMVAVQDPLVWSIILTVPHTPSLSMVSSANLMNSRSLTLTSATLPVYGAIQAVMGPSWLYSH